MNKGTIFAVIIILLLAGGAFFMLRDKGMTSNVIQQDAPQNANAQTYTIEMTSTGYEPQTLTIQKGDTITWINKDTRPNWPASAVHPSHKTYPGSDIAKCGTSEENIIFDSCGGIKQGESFSFTFNQQGTWSYHDHLKASLRGTIIVQ